MSDCCLTRQLINSIAIQKHPFGKTLSSTDLQESAGFSLTNLTLDDKSADSKLGQGYKLTMAVARYAYKLMAHNDENEVARLYTSLAFMEKLSDGVKHRARPPCSDLNRIMKKTCRLQYA